MRAPDPCRCRRRARAARSDMYVADVASGRRSAQLSKPIQLVVDAETGEVPDGLLAANADRDLGSDNRNNCSINGADRHSLRFIRHTERGSSAICASTLENAVSRASAGAQQLHLRPAPCALLQHTAHASDVEALAMARGPPTKGTHMYSKHLEIDGRATRGRCRRPARRIRHHSASTSASELEYA